MRPFANHPVRATDPGLVVQLQLLLGSGIASSTRSAYSSMQRSYFRFMLKHVTLIPHPLPATRDWIALWVADMARSLAHASIVHYLYALQSLHVELGLTCDIHDPMIELILSAVRRSQSDREKKKRLPITTALIDAIRPLLDMSLHDDRMIMAAASTATGGMLRVGEAAATSIEPDRYLRYRDCEIGRAHV